MKDVIAHQRLAAQFPLPASDGSCGIPKMNDGRCLQAAAARVGTVSRLQTPVTGNGSMQRGLTDAAPRSPVR